MRRNRLRLTLCGCDVPTYLLGNVKPWVKTAADTLGAKYGIRTIYGIGPGSIAGSDHPKGLALDFMTSSKATGDALAADLIANAGPYAVKYIVWWKQSWNPERGTWAKYTSTTNPHYDHVHVSFKDKAGSGTPTVVTPVGLPGQAELQSLLGIARDFNAIVQWFTKAENWRRIGIGAAGMALIGIGIIALLGKNSRDTAPVVQVVKAVKKVAK